MSTKQHKTAHKPTAKAEPPASSSSETLRWVLVGALVLVVFFGAYRFASSRQGGAAVGPGNSSQGSQSPAGGVTGPPTEGAATLANGVQTMSVDVVGGSYSPNIIRLKANVPAQITFAQSQGCTQFVQSKDLGFQEDVSAGPKTVQLQGLKPGTYSFSCGMSMVFGKVIVE